MARKLKLDKVAYDALSDDAKKDYKADGAGYILDLEDYEDPAELKRAKDREVAERKKEKDRADALQAQIDADAARRTAADDDLARKNNDIKTLETSWADKSAKEKKAIQDRLDKRERSLQRLLADAQADALALQLGGGDKNRAAALRPHLTGRLKADLDGDEPTTRVLDAQGQISALTLDDLATEFRANPIFSSIIVASKASGSGAAGNQSGGAPGKKLSEMTTVERNAYYQRDPDGFKRDTDAENAGKTRI